MVAPYRTPEPAELYVGSTISTPQSQDRKPGSENTERQPSHPKMAQDLAVFLPLYPSPNSTHTTPLEKDGPQGSK